MSIDDAAPEELALIGYEKLAAHGFALPCFARTPGANTVYVARPSRPGDSTAPIEGFDIYEPEEIQSLPPEKRIDRARVGDPWVDVFLWGDDVFAGTKPQIWSSIAGIRNDIAANAPLSLLNLAEGVPGVATGDLARAAFAWLERRQSTDAASEWRISVYFRGIAIRTLRRLLKTAAYTSRIRRALQSVELVQNDTTLSLRLPAPIPETLHTTATDFGGLIRAAQEFGFHLIIVDDESATPATTVQASHWSKKLSRSDAQRKSTGNQRGSITLVQAGYPIDGQTYFRRDFFKAAKWVGEITRTSEVRETAVISFKVNFLGKDLGALPLSVTYAPNREANQTNYTSLLHLGPLAPHVGATDVTGKWLRLDRRTDGSYALSILDRAAP